jgi:hypothetical protein
VTSKDNVLVNLPSRWARQRPPGTRNRWGAVMSIREKLFFALILMWIVLSFFLSHFWSTVYAFQKMVVFGVLPLVVSKIASVIARISFFP